MKSPAFRFNTYLLLLASLLAGCQSNPFRSKELTTLRLYLEVNPDGTDRNGPVAINRAKPVYVNVETEPFLKEGHIERAAILDVPGGFEIELTFARKGRWLLEQYSTAHLGKRVAIYAMFEEPRFLGAPVFRRPLTDGSIRFTPDATREEAERIVKGLNNVAKAVANGSY